MITLVWLFFLTQIGCSVALAENRLTTEDTSRRALSQPMPILQTDELAQFSSGRSLFNQMWVIAPSRDDDIDGLGPLFNSLSCLECHAGNGRGHAPDGPNDRMRGMLVRLSQPGDNPFDALPHPIYGNQLQDQAIPGVPAEGNAVVHYLTQFVTLADGKQVELRQPTISLHNPGYGDWGEVLTSGRIGPPLIGMGLIEVIDDSDIERIAAKQQQQDGIAGRINQVWDPVSQQYQKGRFGHKASIVTLTEQIASAFHADLGLTSSLFPNENCTAVQIACQQAPTGGTPELSDQQIDDVTFYLRFLALPAHRQDSDPVVIKGRKLFEQAACAVCHQPTLNTRADAKPAFFANRRISPYSDFLLHDMGEALADPGPEGGASGREWRTAPLWGIGLAETVSDQVGYLHDGRARTLLEAILWHGGSAQNSRDQVIEMTTAEREALLLFLKSL